jgi:hypothetical protein
MGVPRERHSSKPEGTRLSGLGGRFAQGDTVVEFS